MHGKYVVGSGRGLSVWCGDKAKYLTIADVRRIFQTRRRKNNKIDISLSVQFATLQTIKNLCCVISCLGNRCNDFVTSYTGFTYPIFRPCLSPCYRASAPRSIDPISVFNGISSKSRRALPSATQHRLRYSQQQAFLLIHYVMGLKLFMANGPHRSFQGGSKVTRGRVTISGILNLN